MLSPSSLPILFNFSPFYYFIRMITAYLILCLVSPLFCLTPQEAADRAKTSWAKADNFIAEFSLEVHWDLSGEINRDEGTVYIQKPDKYRLETTQSVVVTDGKTFYRYSKAKNQVMVNDLINAEESYNPQSLFINTLLRFKAETQEDVVLGKKNLLKIHMLPQDPKDFIVSLELYITPDTYQIKRIEMKDKSDNLSYYTIKSLKTPSSIPARHFLFTPPAGAELLDLR